MTSHVDFVGVLFILWGALLALLGTSILVLSVGAAALVASNGGGGSVAAGLAVAIFMTLAFIAMTWGAGHILIGFPLRRHRHWSRTAALFVGSIDVFLLPYGTALGCYALWVLLSEQGKELFAVRYP
jgi:hypothetical protein